MSVYQHVLAAVDLGKHSKTVLQHAAAMAQLCEAEMTVLHVVNYILPYDLDYVMPPEDDTEQKLITAAEQQLQKLLEREALDSGVKSIVVAGRPKVEIARVMEREQVDLVVVGAHNLHGLFNFLGSTADRVLRQASCDVLTVR